MRVREGRRGVGRVDGSRERVYEGPVNLYRRLRRGVGSELGRCVGPCVVRVVYGFSLGRTRRGYDWRRLR